MGAGGVAWADLVTAFGADEHQFCTTARAGGVVLTDGCPAVRAECLSTGGTFRRAGRYASAAARAGGSTRLTAGGSTRLTAGGSTRLTAGRDRLKPAAGAGALFGDEHQAALRTQARPTRGAGALRRQKPGAADGTHRPADEHRPNTPGYAPGCRALLVGHRLKAVGAAVWGAKEGLAAGRAAPAKDQPAVGAHLCSGEKFHAAPGAGERQFQAAVGAPFGVLVYGRAAARAERMPTRRTGRVAEVDPGSAPGAGRVAGLLSLRPWLRPDFIFGLLGPRGELLYLCSHCLEVAARPVHAPAAGAATEFGVGSEHVGRHAVGDLGRRDGLQHTVAHSAAGQRRVGWGAEAIPHFLYLLLQHL